MGQLFFSTRLAVALELGVAVRVDHFSRRVWPVEVAELFHLGLARFDISGALRGLPKAARFGSLKCGLVELDEARHELAQLARIRRGEVHVLRRVVLQSFQKSNI